MSMEWAPLVTAPMGAIIGAGAGYALSRSRLTITIDRIQIAPSQAATSLPVPVNTILQQEVRDFPEELPNIDGVTSPERTYVAFLERLKEEVDDRSRELETAEKAADELRRLAAAEEFGKFIESCRFHHNRLWAWAGGDALRGKNGYSGSWSPPGDEDTPFHEIIEIENIPGANAGAYLVRFPGVINVAFDWDTDRPEQAQKPVKEAAWRTSVAVAFHVKQDLMDYCSWVRGSIASARQALSRIESVTLAELNHYARLQVAVLVSNTGRSGVSLGNEAVATVFLEGYSGAGGKEPSDVSIPLVAMSAESADSIRRAAMGNSGTGLRANELSPVLIQAGETVRVIAVSKGLLMEYPAAASLRSAYTAAEREIRVSLARFGQPRSLRRQNRDALRVLRSRKVLFRDLRLAGNV